MRNAYRSNAVDCWDGGSGCCLLPAGESHISVAASWLSLARQDEAIDYLLARVGRR
jgi:hypothetical protein